MHLLALYLPPSFFFTFSNVAYLVDEFSILPRTVTSLADICSSCETKCNIQYVHVAKYSGVDSRKERTPSITMAGTLGKVCNLYLEILKILRCLKTSITGCVFTRAINQLNILSRICLQTDFYQLNVTTVFTVKFNRQSKPLTQGIQIAKAP